MVGLGSAICARKPGKHMSFRICYLTVMAALLAFSATAQNTDFASFEIASQPVVGSPQDLTIGPGGLLYVADGFAGEIKVLDPDTLEVLGSFGQGQLFGVRDISFGPDRRAYVAVPGLNRVDVFDVDGVTGVYVESFGNLTRTEGALAHSNGRLYAMASGIGTLVMIDDSDDPVAVGGLFGSHDVAEAPDGSIWVANNAAGRLVQYDSDLNLLQILAGPEFGLLGARYLDVDDFGRLVVADMDAHRVLLIDPEAPVGSRLLGVIGDGVPGLGPGKFDSPRGAAVSGNSYYFSDSANSRVVKYTVLLN